MNRQIFVISKIPKLTEMLMRSEQYVQLQKSYNLTLCEGDFKPIDRNQQLKTLCDSEILLADPPSISSLLHEYTEFGKLKWFQSTWAGVEKIINAQGLKCVIVTRIGGVFAKQMAEYCISWIVSEERNFISMLKDQSKKEWNPYLTHRTLSSLKLGILGFGSIGQELSNIFVNSFGSEVLALCTDEKKYQKLIPQIEILSGPKGLLRILQNSDYLINVLPHTPETIGLLNGDILSNSNPSLIFINVGRGSIISSQDLLNALEKKWIKGAILDVFEAEPLNKESKLWDMENVKITPHVSALSTKEDISKIFIENLELYLKNKEMKWIVNKEKFY